MKKLLLIMAISILAGTDLWCQTLFPSTATIQPTQGAGGEIVAGANQSQLSNRPREGGDVMSAPMLAGTVPANSDSDSNSEINMEKLAGKSLSMLLSEGCAGATTQEQQRYSAAIIRHGVRNREDVELLFAFLDRVKPEDPGNDWIKPGVIATLEHMDIAGRCEYLVPHIKHGSYQSKYAAVRIAGQNKCKEAVPALISKVKGYHGKITKYLEKQKVFVRYEAARSLGEIGDDRAIPVLFSKLGMGHVDYALAKFGGQVLPRLLVIGRNTKSEDVRSGVVNTIVFMRDKTVVGDMWKIAMNKNDYLQWAAYQMLLNTADDSTTPTMNQIMDWVMEIGVKDKNWRNEAVDCAKKRKDVRYLISVLKKTVDGEPTHGEISALSELKAKEAVPLIESLYYNEPFHASHRGNKEGFAVSLVEITGDISYLVKLAQNKKSTSIERCSAVSAILSFKSTAAISKLQELRNDSDSEVRDCVSYAVELLSGAKR